MNTRTYIRLFAAAAAVITCLMLRTAVGCCVVLGVLAAFLLGEGIVTDMRRKRRLTELTDYITRVQDDLSLAAPECSDEGLTGILQSEIYKVVALLREQYSAEKDRKEYMSDMLSDISHQIKTPLTAIQLMTELLEQSDLDAEKRMQYAEKIDSQVGRITWLIRNLLTLSQLEAGVLQMKPTAVGLSELMGDIRTSLEIMAEVRGVTLEFEMPDAEIDADRHWLREALMNIIKNCIEHTDEGGYVRVNGTQNNICTELTIEDNGSGISEKDLPHIFERFYKADNSSPQSVGIGLALAKNIINAHSGIIEVSSTKGKGTVFTVKLYTVF